MIDIKKYPRTPHVEGSGIQRGDDDLATVPFDALAGRHLVVTEKVDGANCAVRFTAGGDLLLQSRGHYLAGGERERQFHLFKAWANRYAAELLGVLEDRYIMYGEWLYAKHTVFYTRLPHYFLEFDVYDTVEDVFLSTQARHAVLAAAPFVVPVRVVHEGVLPSLHALLGLVGISPFIGANVVERLQSACRERELDPELALRQTDTSRVMEGLYIKVEDERGVQGRYKYVRPGFHQAIADAQGHWMNRPIIPNILRDGVTLFSSPFLSGAQAFQPALPTYALLGAEDKGNAYRQCVIIPARSGSGGMGGGVGTYHRQIQVDQHDGGRPAGCAPSCRGRCPDPYTNGGGSDGGRCGMA